MSEETKEYVLVWCRKGNNSEETLLILKDRPAWQAGRLNLPGGKIEPGETPEQAAARELKEETGYDCVTEPRIMGKMVDRNFVIWVLRTVIFPDKEPQPREGETEVPMWFKWSEVSKDKRLIPNLKVIVPLCMTGMTDFIIGDTYRSGDSDRHTIKISVLDQGENEPS